MPSLAIPKWLLGLMLLTPALLLAHPQLCPRVLADFTLFPRLRMTLQRVHEQLHGTLSTQRNSRMGFALLGEATPSLYLRPSEQAHHVVWRQLTEQEDVRTNESDSVLSFHRTEKRFGLSFNRSSIQATHHTEICARSTRFMTNDAIEFLRMVDYSFTEVVSNSLYNPKIRSLMQLGQNLKREYRAIATHSTALVQNHEPGFLPEAFYIVSKRAGTEGLDFIFPLSEPVWVVLPDDTTELTQIVSVSVRLGPNQTFRVAGISPVVEGEYGPPEALKTQQAFEAFRTSVQPSEALRTLYQRRDHLQKTISDKEAHAEKFRQAYHRSVRQQDSEFDKLMHEGIGGICSTLGTFLIFLAPSYFAPNSDPVTSSPWYCFGPPSLGGGLLLREFYGNIRRYWQNRKSWEVARKTFLAEIEKTESERMQARIELSDVEEEIRMEEFRWFDLRGRLERESFVRPRPRTWNQPTEPALLDYWNLPHPARTVVEELRLLSLLLRAEQALSHQEIHALLGLLQSHGEDYSEAYREGDRFVRERESGRTLVDWFRLTFSFSLR